jgi:addiction module HigA family antidote
MEQAVRGSAVHPGEVLQEEFLTPLGMTAYRLAKALGIPESAVGEILHGKRGITAATALRLARFFGTSAELWVNLQAAYELDEERARLQERLTAIEPLDLDELHRQRMQALEERRRVHHAALEEERLCPDPEWEAVGKDVERHAAMPPAAGV